MLDHIRSLSNVPKERCGSARECVTIGYQSILDTNNVHDNVLGRYQQMSSEIEMREANRSTQYQQEDGHCSDWAIHVPHAMVVCQSPNCTHEHED